MKKDKRIEIYPLTQIRWLLTESRWRRYGRIAKQIQNFSAKD